MEPLFEFCADDIEVMLPHMKEKLMSGSENAQVSVVEQILMFLRKAAEPDKGVIVRRLVKFDVISAICDVMQTSDENFVKVVLDCLELISVHEGFYEDHAAVNAVDSMLRLTYCVNKSLKNSALFERLVQGICIILVRSIEFTADLDAVCVSQQIISFLKSLDIRAVQKDRMKFAAVAILNVVLQRAVFDGNVDVGTLVDVCDDAIRSMTEIVKYGDDDETILYGASALCGTCAGGSRFCNDVCARVEAPANDDVLRIYQRTADLSIFIYNTTITVIVPYVKNADLSGVDPIKFHRNLASCLNNLYQLGNCDHDNLSNHLAVNGYLMYFLRLTVLLQPENLRRSVCVLLSRILSILGKTAFSSDIVEFANILRQGLVELPRELTAERWNDTIACNGKNGMALMILLYYHYHGTEESDMVSLQSLIARIMLLPESQPVSALILKPLWFLFAVTSINHPSPNSTDLYEDAVTRLTNILQRSEIDDFYTHHIDLLHYCLKCPDVSQSLINQVLDLWLIESDGNIKPLLPFNCDRVVHRLLIVIQTGCPRRIISLAVKGLCHLIQIGKDDKHVQQIADIVWHMLPNVLTSCQSNSVAHIEAALELANITRPHTVPIYLLIRSAGSIADIILKRNADPKFMTLLVTQAYNILVAAIARSSFKVVQIYIHKSTLLKELYVYGFSKERSELSTISIKLLGFIIHCQKETFTQCKQPLMIHIKNLVELLLYTKESPYSSINEIRFIREILKQHVDSPVVILQKIAIDTVDMEMVINLYETLHMIHVQSEPIQRDVVYQCFVALLHFCNVTLNALMPHLCTVMSNYDLIFNVVNTQYVSCHFVEFVTTWLHHRKTHCHDVPWNPRSLYKLPFDEVLDRLQEYSAIVAEKGSEDAYTNLQRALSQFE